MSRDEIREIAQIAGDDSKYRHFIHRINKEFEGSDEERNAHVYVLFEEANGARIGFCVVGQSQAKMKTWAKTFKEEQWVDSKFQMENPSFELMYMYIRPEYRHQGFAINLFERTIAFAKDNGAKAIYAYVSDKNNTALNFYKRMKAAVIQDLSEEGISSAFLKWKI